MQKHKQNIPASIWVFMLWLSGKQKMKTKNVYDLVHLSKGVKKKLAY